MSDPRRVVVLGAGIAGLTAAYRLPAEGFRVTVLEAGTRLGGSIVTLRTEEGLSLEGGPNTLRTSEAADRLLRDLDLEPEVVSADPLAPRWIVRGGRPRAIVPGPKGLFTSALSWGEKLRVLAEWRVPRRAASVTDESVHDFFARRFGAGVARYAAGPIVSGVYADDPATLSVRSAFPRLWLAEERSGSVIKDFVAGPKAPGPRYRPRTLNFRRGLATLVETLAARLEARGSAVVTGADVLSIEGPLEGSPAWRVRTSDGRTFEADVVLSTVEAPAVARLLEGRLPRSGARLAAVKSSALAVVLQAFDVKDPRDAPRGFGALVPRGEGLRSLGILYPASLFPGRVPEGTVLTTSFLGGALEPDLAAAPEADHLRLAETEVRRLHPALPAPRSARIVRWPRAIPRLPLGHHETLALLDEDLSRLPASLHVTGGFRDGVALGERITRGEDLAKTIARA